MPKGDRRLGGLDAQIISLYAGGMTVRDIGAHLQRTLGATTPSSSCCGWRSATSKNKRARARAKQKDEPRDKRTSRTTRRRRHRLRLESRSRRARSGLPRPAAATSTSPNQDQLTQRGRVLTGPPGSPTWWSPTAPQAVIALGMLALRGNPPFPATNPRKRQKSHK